MAEETREDVLGGETSALHACARCDQPSRHLIQFIGADNRPHYLCWSCLSREEKHFNLKPSWKRGRR